MWMKTCSRIKEEKETTEEIIRVAMIQIIPPRGGIIVFHMIL
jgi:hypothetical protein